LPEPELTLPTDGDFLWGVGTSAYQIEGAVDVDGRGPSIWDKFCRQPRRIADGASGDDACAHYRNWRQDLDLLSELGVTGYRFSIAWPRIQPHGPDDVNQRGIDFYRELIAGLVERGITPFVTLYHWDLPQWAEDRGGWAERQCADWFADYADLVHAAVHQDVRHLVTINEPWVSAWLGYGWGDHAPGRTDFADALRAGHHLLLGHARAYRRFHARAEDAVVGPALSLSPVHPVTDEHGKVSDVDEEAARWTDDHYNGLFLRPVLDGDYPQDVLRRYAALTDTEFIADGDLAEIHGTADFLGVNYYRVVRVRRAPDDASGLLMGDEVRDPAVPTTQMGWPVEPAGLTELLRSLSTRYPRVPLYLTENGSAFPDEVSADDAVHDQARIDYLRAHIDALGTAVADGADVRGYFAWSLLDNFEWSQGYRPRFGLVHVDYATQRRRIKDSGRWYADLIADWCARYQRVRPSIGPPPPLPRV
jgi:beta-glucosidase